MINNNNVESNIYIYKPFSNNLLRLGYEIQNNGFYGKQR